MRYGRTAKSERWHQLHEGEPLCLLYPNEDGTRSSLAFTFVEECEGPVDAEKVCGNCTEAMARKGRSIAKAQKKASVSKPSRRDVYEPRNRFKG